MQPAWITPLEHTEPPHGFTFGLVSTELAERALTDELLERRLGRSNLLAAGRQLGRASGVEPELDDAAIAHLSGWLKTLRPAMRAVLLAADDGVAFKPNEKTERQMLRLAKIYASRVYPVRLALRDGTVAYAPRSDTLVGRVALEVGWLLSERPTLRRCRHCDSVFVAGHGRTRCAWVVWDGDAIVDDTCGGNALPRDQAAHVKKRKSLSAALRYATKGSADPAHDERVKRAKREYANYMKENGRTAGRPKSRPPVTALAEVDEETVRKSGGARGSSRAARVVEARSSMGRACRVG